MSYPGEPLADTFIPSRLPGGGAAGGLVQTLLRGDALPLVRRPPRNQPSEGILI